MATRLFFLDWLRIIAFLTVFIGHKFHPALIQYSQDPNIHITLKNIIDFCSPIFVGGGGGVIIFFMVSGYIITHVISKESTPQFLIKRFFRIYPLFVFAILMHTCLNYFVQQSFPGWDTILMQLTLFGDFFETPNTLAGVDWSLRIEVLFYLFMAAIKKLDIFNNSYKLLLPSILLIITIIIFSMPQFPGKWSWFHGYLNLYAPFLILGSVYYLFENSRVTTTFCVLFTLLVLLIHWILVPILQPGWQTAKFVIYAYGIFITLWLFRKNISLPKWAFFTSELTYCFYLLHNWLYGFLVTIFLNISKNQFFTAIMSTIALFIISYLCTLLIERPGIRIGNKLIHMCKYIVIPKFLRYRIPS